MKLEFQHYFLESIFRMSKPEHVLSQEIIELTGQSKANVYKKLNKAVPFSIEEIITLARHFNISLDRFIHHQNDFSKVIFDYSPQAPTPVAFLEKIKNDLERIVLLPQAAIFYATNEIPLFYSLACPKLTAFKLFLWSRANWKLPEVAETRFDPEQFYADWPQLDAHRTAILDLYAQIPGKEYWSRTVVDNILNQINYYLRAGFFVRPETAAQLHQELLEMLDIRKKSAAAQEKFPEGGVPYSLYLNETAFTNNIILILSNNQPMAVYATMDNPNFVRSTDADFCRRMQQWIAKVEEVSFNTANELYRESLFSELKTKVAGRR